MNDIAIRLADIFGNAQWAFVIMNMITGACIGSFLNVVVGRNDEQEVENKGKTEGKKQKDCKLPSWVTGRSRCDNCGYTLQWYDLIPIVSFLMYRGKCRKCGKKIDPRHLIAEILFSIGFGISALVFRDLASYVCMIIFMVLVGYNVIEDLHTETMVCFVNHAAILAIFGVWFLSQPEKFGAATMAVVVPIILLVVGNIVVSILDKDENKFLGNGDLDILITVATMGAVVSGVTGNMGGMYISSLGFASCLKYALINMMYCTFYTLFYACLIGSAYCVPQIVMKKMDRKQHVPFIPFLFLGYSLYALIGAIV